jgi:predicted RNA-binding Zn-ribbon protein involved in translation (DUF1610 family)
MRSRLRMALVVLGIVLYAAFGWIAGLVALAVGVVLVLRRVLRARRALAPTTRCTWCREDVAQYGAFTCTNCHSRALGWAWRCPICSAWAGHVECPACGMSVPNPLLGAP